MFTDINNLQLEFYFIVIRERPLYFACCIRIINVSSQAIPHYMSYQCQHIALSKCIRLKSVVHLRTGYFCHRLHTDFWNKGCSDFAKSQVVQFRIYIIRNSLVVLKWWLYQNWKQSLQIRERDFPKTHCITGLSNHRDNRYTNLKFIHEVAMSKYMYIRPCFTESSRSLFYGCCNHRICTISAYHH